MDHFTADYIIAPAIERWQRVVDDPNTSLENLINARCSISVLGSWYKSLTGEWYEPYQLSRQEIAERQYKAYYELLFGIED